MPSLPSSRPEAALFAPSRRRRAGTVWRWTTGLLFVAWSLAVLAWLTLHWGILPRLDHWRPQIEQRLGAALGAPVSIGAIRVRSGGWVPALELDDVRLLDAAGLPALQLGHVLAALAPTSLLSGRPRLAQLHLDGVQLDVRRDAEGRLRIAGMDLDAGAGDAGATADAPTWFFEQQEFVIRRGTLRWTDERSQAPPLVLTDVDLVIRNGLRRHELRLDATPPPQWGARFALRGQFTQPLVAAGADGAASAPWRGWRGTLYADLPHADVAELGRHVALPFELSEGRGALRAWLDIDGGQPVGGTADLALEAVSLRLAPQLQPMALSRLLGRVTARLAPDALSFAVEGLRFETDDAVEWAHSQLRLTLQRAHAGSPGVPGRPDGRLAIDADAIVGGRLSADRLDLDVVASLGARLPLPDAVHRMVADLAPRGQVQDLSLQWQGPLQSPQSWQAGLRVSDLALAAGPPGPPAWGRAESAGRPGLHGASIELQASEAGGQAELQLRAGALVLPGVLAAPELPFDDLHARLQWRVTDDASGAAAVELQVQEARFANADVSGTLSGTWRTGPGEGFGAGARLPGQIDLRGRIAEGRTERVARYLPLGIPAETRQWVARAIGPGRLRDGEFQVRGDIWHFPYTDGSPGAFRIRARVEDMALAYVPSEPGWDSPWPAMQDVTGEIEFDRGRMRIGDARAQVAGVALRGVHGGVEDLVANPVLQLEGQGRGPLAAMLGFVETTPVGEWIGGALDDARATGVANLDLALAIPIADPSSTTTKGSVQLAGNDLRLLPGTPALGSVRGRVDFSHQGFQIVAGRARVLGGDASFEGGTQPDGSLRFHGQGVATAEALRTARDVPALAPLARLGTRLSGQSPYRVELQFRQGWPELRVTSSLTGMVLNLPPPMDKSAGDAWPLRVQTTRLASQDADLLSIDIDHRLQARYERDLAGETVRIRRGAIGVGVAPPPLPARGVTAQVAWPRVDVDAWQAALEARPDDARPSAGAPLSDLAQIEGSEGGDALPTQAVLRAAEMRLGGRRFGDVTLEWQRQAQRADTLWSAQVRADEAEGTVEYRQPHAPGAPGRLQARLSRLTLAAPGPAAVAPAAGVAGPPDAAPPAVRSTVPALDLVVDDFRWRGLALGRLEVEAVNRAAGAGSAAREWRLDRLRIHNDDADLQGRGLWAPGRRMALDFGIALSDSGRLAERLGMAGVLQGGKGRIDGELSWAGSPLAPDLASLGGSMRIALDEGRFLQAEPGVARLLGVLSLQSLPRRLLLDFRDVFQQGFVFDKVTGDVRIARGVAETDNLRLIGVQAGVLVEGRADLRAETQDLRIVVVPELNAGAASLAYAAINPVVGLGTFLAQLLLRQPMMAAGTREFSVTGPWNDPQVQRVDRGAAAAAAAAASAQTGEAGTR